MVSRLADSHSKGARVPTWSLAKQWRDAQVFSLGAVLRGDLTPLGVKKVLGKVFQPINSPSRYPEYILLDDILSRIIRQSGSRKVLDISSPKLFSLLLASKHPIEVVLTDPYEPAVEEARRMSFHLSDEIRNRLHFGCFDARKPIPLPESFGNQVDLVYAMSVLEHVEPAQGGDVLALTSLAAQVASQGYIAITMPVGPRSVIEYREEEIYGRSPDADGRIFFQRVYDSPMIEALASAVAGCLTLREVHTIQWPETSLWSLLMSPKVSDNTRALMGPLFPLVAKGCRTRQHGHEVPTVLPKGDVVLVFQTNNSSG